MAKKNKKTEPAPESAADAKMKSSSAKNENIAGRLASQQREISVSEFFSKNRHLLGFDNPKKALLTAVKEAVDNSLDACEEAGILPDIEVRVDVVQSGSAVINASQAERFLVTVADNGPGLPKKSIGKVFAKLLFGSKFHRLRQSRGQQGIGISAAGMYGQLTTGKPTGVITKTKNDPTIHVIEVSIDTKRNEPVEHETRFYTFDAANPPLVEVGRQKTPWIREHGTAVSIELGGRYQKGRGSVEEYMDLTAISNPHARLTYHSPEGITRVFERGVDKLPEQPKEIKPHPRGIELGMLLKMLQDTPSRRLAAFLSSDFCRVSSRMAGEICKAAGLNAGAKPRSIVGHDAEALYKALQNAKLMSPPTDCLSPIGEPSILAGLLKSLKADFYTATTRPPKVYRGNPFVIEAGIAFGKGEGAAAAKKATQDIDLQAKAEGEVDDEDEELARVIRFANRVPLVYQQSACAMYKAVLRTAWRNYGLSQSRGALPSGPLVVFIHMASVWVPFTSEAKEAIAEYDEIVDEAKRALQECGRKLGVWLRRRELAKGEFERRTTFQRYIEEVAESVGRMKAGKIDTDRLKKQLAKIAENVTGGEKTDKILGKNRPAEPDGLAYVVERTEEGLKGEVPALLAKSTDEGPIASREPVESEGPENTGEPEAKAAKQKNRSTGNLKKRKK